MRKTAAAALVTVLLLAAAALSYRAYSRRAADAPDVSRLIPGDLAVVVGGTGSVVAEELDPQGGVVGPLMVEWKTKVRVVSDPGPVGGLWADSREVTAELFEGERAGARLRFRRYELRRVE
jgi:hypothetical protein